MCEAFKKGYCPSCKYVLRQNLNTENRAPEKILVYSTT